MTEGESPAPNPTIPEPTSITTPTKAPRAGSDSFALLIWNHPVTRIVVYTSLFVVLMVMSQVLLQVLSGLERRSPALGSQAQNASEALSVLIATWIMVRFAENRRMRDVGFTWRGVVVDTLVGTMIGTAVISCSVGILALIGAYKAVAVVAGFSPWLPLATFLLVAISEETYFRGFVFRVLEYRYGSLIAIIVGSLFFGGIHIVNETQSSMPFAEKIAGPAMISLEAGLLLSAAYMATRRMWLGIGIHWAWNYFEGPVYGSTVSGTSGFGSLVNATLDGPFLIAGGQFGLEASLITLVVCTVAGLMLVRVAVRAGQWKPIGQWQPQTLSSRNT